LQSSFHATEDLLFLTLLQLIAMIVAARIGNTVFRRFGQPGVVGEVVAGLVLGPSLFGYFFPGAFAFVFGGGASVPISVISQIGLVFLMFQIGMEFDFHHLTRPRSRSGALGIAAASVGVSFALGFGAGELSAPVLAPHIDALTYSLFFGIALAITAVPVLGRILREFGMAPTEIGVVAISAAAFNDVVGWVLLAAISAYASARFSLVVTGLQIGAVVLLMGAALFGVRPLAARLLAAYPVKNGEIASNLIALVIALMFALGIVTFELGIFTIFGGFIAGLIFHEHKPFAEAWRHRVGQFVIVFFLPVFFTFTGLRTNVLGLSSAGEAVWLAGIVAAAVLGKIVPVYFASRIAGFKREEAAVLGALMNTRGLMELIVLNIGFDLGFIPQTVFTMLVIMAAATTMMTGPLLRVLLPRTGFAVPRGLEA
jgi:Kef-type K+ transport system membrane component KefB